SSSRRRVSPPTTRCGPTPAPGARSCACWSGFHEEGPAASSRTGPPCAALARGGLRHLGAARGRRPHRRGRAGRAGPPGLSARRREDRARARRGAHPPARDRGGDLALPEPHRGARPADRPGGRGPGPAPAGGGGRRRRHRLGGRPESRGVPAHLEAARSVKDPAVRTRVLLLAAILALAFGGLTARLGWLMVVKHGELAQLAERQYSRTMILYAQRGPI